ncbi:unnamed protein product, partial [Amoebophrya sp. A25]
SNYSKKGTSSSSTSSRGSASVAGQHLEQVRLSSPMMPTPPPSTPTGASVSSGFAAARSSPFSSLMSRYQATSSSRSAYKNQHQSCTSRGVAGSAPRNAYQSKWVKTPGVVRPGFWCRDQTGINSKDHHLPHTGQKDAEESSDTFPRQCSDDPSDE